MTDRSRLRLVILRLLVLSLFLTLLGRLYYVQLAHGATYRKAASQNNVRDIVTPAPRGLILDDQGRTLAGNADAEVVSVNRSELIRLPVAEQTAVLQRLGVVLHLSSTDLSARLQACNAHGQPLGCWNGSPYQPVPVSDKVSTATAFAIQENAAAFPAVQVEVQQIRDYPQYTADPATRVYASHLLGYLGPISQAELAKLPAAEQAAHLDDLVGRSGLEQEYNSALAGQPGIERVSVDHLGNVTGLISNTPPVAGDDLVTSLDAGVQRDLEHALVAAMQHARTIGRGGGAGPADTAAGVVMDAQTGRIVAMASYPNYAPNAFVGGISVKAYQALLNPKNGTPLENRAIEGAYLPGSTFKLLTASAALASGEASPSGIYDCSSGVSFGGGSFSNFESESAGPISLHDAIVMSCDTVFYGFGEEQYLSDQNLIAHGKKPAEVVAHMAMAYGLGSASGVDLPGEGSGILFDRQGVYNYWKTVDVPNACKGAKNKHFSATRRYDDEQLCLYGGIFEPGDQLLMDIGQGGSVGVSPLQMAIAYSALVNGGTVWSPRIGEALVSPTGEVVARINPAVRGHVPVPKADLTYIEDAMYGVTQQQSPVRGTGTGAFAGFPFNRVDVGGKTGTADVSAGPNDHRAPNAWFDSFAGPPGHPRYVAAIVVTNGGQGGITSAPAARTIWEDVFGLDGHHADLPGGVPPAHLPAFDPQGALVSPAPMPPVNPATPGAVAMAALPAELRRNGVPQ